MQPLLRYGEFLLYFQQGCSGPICFSASEAHGGMQEGLGGGVRVEKPGGGDLSNRLADTRSRLQLRQALLAQAVAVEARPPIPQV